MARQKLLEELKRRPLLCDGGMGTQLIAAGLAPGECGEKWNLDRSEVIESVHRRYRSAGCELLTTNSFGGTRAPLERHGLAREVRSLNHAAVQAAKRAAGDEAWVLGDVGPFGGFLEPVGEATADDVMTMFVEQADALVGGVDGFIIETMSDSAEMVLAIRALRKVSDLPIIATYAFSKSPGAFRTMMGTPLPEAISAAIHAGADVVGANCGTGLDLRDYIRLAGDLVTAAGSTPAILQPNAGSPRNENGQFVYDATPADMAGIVGHLLTSGLRIVGGCCGTTPEHLAAMSQAMKTSLSR